MTKMPPPFSNSKPPKPYDPNEQNHKSQNHKNYEPMNWDLFFDDLTYLDDVKIRINSGNIRLQSR